jgi:hypothetical protein
MKSRIFLVCAALATGALLAGVSDAEDQAVAPTAAATQSAAGTAESAPAGDDGKAASKLAKARAWWAYQAPRKTALPDVHTPSWVRTPVDAFVLAQLDAKGLKPNPEADRVTLIRRVTLDVTGLVPTPEEVTAFVNDRSDDAYGKLVERLLASPHYGERWGRRWLDLTRYADSDGYNTDGTRPNAWRYRDYVVKAFNDDKPYDQFIREQIAGDELWPDRKDTLVATGFLRNLPDEINARDLNLKKQEIANDLTDTVGTVFLGTTVGCAQCHNHKFDPISTREYYQLQAYFVNTSFRDDVQPLEGKALEDYKAQKARWEEATKEIRAQQEAILKPTIDKLESDRLSGFVPATRDAITKPESQRDAYERWIYHRSLWTMTGRTRNAVNQLKEKEPEAYEKYQKLDAELKKFDRLKPREPGWISTATELEHADSPITHVLFKGIYDRPQDQVEPAVPAVLTADGQPEIRPTAKSSGRRTAIANWIASANNPVTSRVFVNRTWAQYFGHGIVETVSDFGHMGQKPTHPELLDWLALNFVEHGWSVKQLQRQILLSSTYRQSSASRQDAAELDPTDRLLWSFPRQRLDAEEIRDSLLAASGLLEDKLGGPAVFPPVPAQLDNLNAWKVSDNPHDHFRRSLYIFVRRNTPYPFLDTFDWANPQIVHSRREVTTTAPQALALVNSEVVYQYSQELAGRVLREVGDNDAARLDRLYQLLLSRTPEREEKQALLTFLDTQQKTLQKQLASGKKVVAPAGYRETPEVVANLEGLYRNLYGRTPDKFERAALLSYLDTKQERPKKAGDSDDGGDAIAADDSAATAERKNDAARDARAAAFVDLVHAVANSNEFIYRF